MARSEDDERDLLSSQHPDTLNLILHFMRDASISTVSAKVAKREGDLLDVENLVRVPVSYIVLNHLRCSPAAHFTKK